MRSIPCPLVLVYALISIMLPAAPAAWAAEVAGFVRDQSTEAPLSGALVTLQTTSIRTTTAPDGSFQLTIPDDERAVIVAAAIGYFNQSVILKNPGKTEVELLMEAVPQTNSEDYQFLTPDDCGLCHPDQFAQWLETPKANAGSNTWVHDIYSGTGTPGGMGGFVYLRDSVYADSNPASECASCHQPELWVQKPFSPMEEFQFPPSDAVGHGISCEVCHKIAHVNVDQINYPGIFPGAVTFTRPEDPDNGQVQYGILGDVDFRMGFYMRASYQPQLRAEVCAACHQDANDPDENHSFNGVISEPTYLEWLDSPYSDLESPFYADCVDCHMPSYGAETVCDVLYPPLLRDPETIRSHTILGTTPEYLENAVELSMEAELIGNTIEVAVDITNSLTGHHVPTGVTVRNMILLVEAWRVGDDLQLEHLGKQTVHELGGVGDPAEGYYAGLPGKYYSKVNHDANGNGPVFYTDATGIQFDNRIPAMATDSTTYTFAVPYGGGAVQVRARLIYRRAFRFLVDAKQWTEDGHGEPLEDVLPPHFGHLMEMAEQVLPIGAGCAADLDGDGNVDAFDLASLLGSWGPCPGCPADFNGDGAVDAFDLAQLLGHWGPCE